MAIKLYALVIILLSLGSCKGSKLLEQESEPTRFDLANDLLLAHYDCKTDVDDLHSVAALATLIAHPQYARINFHAVAGAYGTQEGLYVPPNDLFELAFGDNWTDAHVDVAAAIAKVKDLAIATLEQNGEVWIAEAGQSDFSASLIKAILVDLPQLDAKQSIHLVQHSKWNEQSAAPENLVFVQQKVDYHKIPDGNALGNGTPGFCSAEHISWKEQVSDPKITEVWQLALTLGNRYNGKEGRYLNKAIAAGGMDFSDFSEVCWIMNLESIRDAKQFFTEQVKF